MWLRNESTIYMFESYFFLSYNSVFILLFYIAYKIMVPDFILVFTPQNTEDRKVCQLQEQRGKGDNF